MTLWLLPFQKHVFTYQYILYHFILFLLFFIYFYYFLYIFLSRFFDNNLKGTSDTPKLDFIEESISLNSQFAVVLNSIICFSVRFCDNSLLLLKCVFRSFLSRAKSYKGFPVIGRYYCRCYQCSFIYKTVFQFFEILIFSQDIWRSIHYVPEINLIS